MKEKKGCCNCKHSDVHKHFNEESRWYCRRKRLNKPVKSDSKCSHWVLDTELIKELQSCSRK